MVNKASEAGKFFSESVLFQKFLSQNAGLFYHPTTKQHKFNVWQSHEQ